MDGSSIVKSGELHLLMKGFMKSSWAKKFCVLYRKTEEHHPSLELFEDKDAFIKHKQNKGKTDVKKIELQNVKYIRSSAQKSGKATEYQIELKCRNQKHFLMFSHESDSADWFTKLNGTVDISEHGDNSSSTGLRDSDEEDNDTDDVITLNEMYAGTEDAQRFAVEVETSDLAKLCNIVGKMTLLVTKQDVAFEHPATRQLRYSFQLAWMRRFGKKQSSQFYFECGRKCPNGEGTITCNTESAKVIHQCITNTSSSRSKLVIPHRPAAPSESPEPPSTPSPDVAKKMPAIAVTSIAANMARRHPGATNTPSLIPITRCDSDEETTSPASRKSAGKSKVTRQASTETASDSLRKSHGQVSDMARALEEKLHTAEEHAKSASFKSKDDSKSVKSKEERKREKDEKKERERKEKDEKKEKERREKEEKKERERREREERKKSKKKSESDVPAPKPNPAFSVRNKNNIYDEPDINRDHEIAVPEDSLYDEASLPPTPSTVSDIVEYAEPYSIKKAPPMSDASLYEDTSSVANNPTRKSAPVHEPVEYAQPFSKKGGVKVASGNEQTAYTDVKIVKESAWKKFGRSEEDEVFEEDYDSIKSAREQILGVPPIPERGYSESEHTSTYDDDEDDTYNRLDFHQPRPASRNPPENLYGQASAKQVGQLEPSLPVCRVAASDSEGEDPEEMYSTASGAYEAPSGVLSNGQNKQVIDAYEEATPMPKPSFSIRPPRQNIYEDIG